jgi:cytochrome c oxidase subunit IV
MSHSSHEHHVSSLPTLWATFFALVALTVLTVVMGMGPINLGWLDVWVVLLIATVKASLVALIFMHLAQDKLFNGVVLVSALVFMGVFLGMCLMDSSNYLAEQQAYVEGQQALLGPTGS